MDQRISDNTLTSTDQSWVPQRGECFVYGLKGIHEVEQVVEMDVGGHVQSCLALTNVFSKKISKTFLPVSQLKCQGARVMVNSEKLSKLKQGQLEFSVCAVDPSLNSNKKIQHYDSQIIAKGFDGLIESYLCVLEDYGINGEKSDKRFLNYGSRLLELIEQEVAYVLEFSVQEAKSWFEIVLKRLRSQ